jgi:phospholipase C
MNSSRFYVLLPVLLVACAPVPQPSTATSQALVPNFDHIVILIFENKEFGSIIGNPNMPVYNQLAQDNTLLTQFYAVIHPSLPNYIAMMSGDTFDINSNCIDCFIDVTSLPDLIEESGRTWKTYQEDMPEPCYIGDHGEYVQKHNPFVYFDAIRLDKARCERSVVPLAALQTDIEAGTLPNFIFITPNLCNSAHDCSTEAADAWLGDILSQLVPALEKEGPNYLIILTWDEGESDQSCCGLAEEAGGRIPVVLISPLVKNNFRDVSPYTHYSLLKTISNAWGLPYLGHAEEDNHRLILGPWKWK